ncbi:MAG: energy transducer TonB [Gemmatimonadetes bacterium]|nr:energy transducer TonB [Gemmatimonadota bacterium]
MRRACLWAMVPWWLVSCTNDPGTEGEARGFELPVVTNPSVPMEYPVALFELRVEGVVRLHLYITESGNIVPESTRIADGSGYPELDSAALRGVNALRFAPARRDGTPVATSFVQPVYFRHPELAAVGKSR